MIRLSILTLSALIAASVVQAHFAFVVPDAKDTNKVAVVFSDTLEPEKDVPIDKLAGLKLSNRDISGKAIPIELKKDGPTLVATLSGRGPRVVAGTIEYGVSNRGDAKPYLIVYHPKALVGGASATLGESAAVELTLAGEPGAPKLRLLAAGKPVANAEVTIIKSDGTKQKLMTGEDGRTPEFKSVGRFGAWAKNTEQKSGEFDGKKYEEVRHYATLVAEAPVVKYPAAPVAASSLGAIICDGSLYVYGGHTGKTHSYSVDTVSGKFHRLNLDGASAWEELPSGPGLQGMNLAAHRGKIYRVGGMSPRNQPGQSPDNISVADCARFDPATKTWEALPPLPEGRSSHDLVVCGDLLIVVGGWCMKGGDASPTWPQSALILDLASAKPEWKAVPQPFERRALTAATVGGKVYVCGGLTDTEMTSTTRRVDIFDPLSGKWTQGPDFPGANSTGFSPAACERNGKLVLSTADGLVHELNGERWEPIGVLTLPRRVHRLVAKGNELLAVGGAAREGNAKSVENVLKY